MVIEAGVATGYLIAWVVRKARRAAGRLDATIDASMDAELDKLDAMVAAKLGAHPVLEDLAEEASSEDGQVSELTRQQVELALTAAARKDDEFGQAVTELVAQIRAAEQASVASVAAGIGSRVFTGDAHAEAHDGGIAVGQVGGDVIVNRGTEGAQQPNPQVPGRSLP